MSEVSDPRAAAFEQAKEARDSALAQLLLELAFLVPRGTDFRKKLGPQLKVYRDAVIALALLKAAPPAEGPTWQPIETAPKDRLILVVYRGQWVYIGQWKEDAAFERCERRPGWEVFEGEDCWYSVSIEPDEATHWMPLPTPPRDPAGKE
jgi:hypothetical protein